MALRISLLLSILVPILAFVNKYNNPHGKITKQTGFSLIRHVDAEKKATSEVFPDENPVTPHPDATQEDVDKAAPEQPTNSSYYNSIHGKDITNNDRPSTKHQGTVGLENFDPPEESIANSNVMNIRKARAISALDLDKFRTGDIQQQGVYNVSHLASMCPYTDICDIQGREVTDKNMDSCCLPCSCAATCGETGNCCDKRENIGNMCHYPLLNVGNMDDIELEYQYFLVDKCLNESQNDCKEMDAASWGSLYPVYDPLSQVNFYNPQCAKCNGVEKYTKWELTLVCRGIGDGIENEFIGRALRGEEVEKCNIKFRPPKTMDILKSVCSDEIPFDRCNITGMWKNYDANLEEACLRWHAPVLRRSGQIIYVNKYCQLCNGGEDHDDLCMTMDPDRFTTKFTLTFTIDYRQVPALVETHGDDKMTPTETGVCSKGMVKHVSQPDCRKLLCPNGFAGSEGNCRPLLAKLLNDLYYIQLQLTPSTDTWFPCSYLKDLTENQRENPEKWFDAQGAPLDYFELHSKGVTINNTEYVESLVVRVGRKKYPLNLDKEIKSIKATIKKQWVIKLKGEVFQFSVRFYRYRWYIPTQYATNKRHVLNYLTLSGEPLGSEPSSPDEHYETDVLYIGFGNPFTLKKTNFCNRVRLTRSEWIAGFEEIRLNTSTEIFDSNKRLGNSEFDIFLDETREPTVEICVEDFNPNHQEQQASGTNTAVMLSSCGILLTTAIWAGYSNHHG